MIFSFRIIAFLEGLSYILLLFIAVPFKYLVGDEQYVVLLGMPHGLLFIAYLILACLLKKNAGWGFWQFGFIIIASLIPLGTFIVDSKYLRGRPL